MRILISSNGIHTNSGYAVEVRDLVFRWAKAGHEVAVSAFWGVQGSPLPAYGHDLIDDRFKDVRILQYPVMGDPYGSDALIAHTRDFKPDIAMCMQDIWTLSPQSLAQLNEMKVPFIPYIPIDQDPPPPEVIDRLRYVHRILTFSKFGHKLILDKGFYSTMIYEGTDTELFKPEDKKEARKKLGIPPDFFYFGMIAANKENPPRKGFQEAMEAFARFEKNHPNSALFFHTQQVSPTGFPIKSFADHLGILKKTFFVNEYLQTYKADSKFIANEMNAIDVLLHPSQTEGFGLTVIEAQACGVPVIIQNCQSMPELIVDHKTGEMCETNYKRFASAGGFWHIADIDSLHAAMERLYDKLNKKNSIPMDCREHIVENFNINTIVEKQWLPLFEKLRKELTKPTPSATVT